jgi:gamma-glutamylputrescine oxidase
VIGLDPAGIRKRIATPSGRVRASQIVLAGGVHLGGSLRRLSDTLLPVWRYVAVTAPLGVRLAEQISFSGAVRDTDGVSHYRIVDGDRLMWCGGDSSWAVSPARFARWVQRQIRTLYPALGTVEIAETFGGVTGLTVHGMPQIGAMRRGVWVASGFGRQGFNTSAMAGQMIARGIVEGDDRWRLFSPFELVWAGGVGGKVVGQAIISLTRGHATVAGTLARYRERAVLRARQRLARAAAAPRRRPPAPPSGSHGGGGDTPRRQITDIGPIPVSGAAPPGGPHEGVKG